MEWLPAYLLFILNVLLLIFWYLDRRAADAERKDLYDRLMAKNLIEYKDNVVVEEKEEEPEPQTEFEIEDAREMITGEEDAE